MNILYASLSQNLIDEQDVESESKRHDEDDEDDGKLGDGVDDVVEHEDEDAEVGHVAEVLEGVQPGKGDEEGSSWPLPASLSFAARRLKLQAEVEDKHKGEEVEKPVNEIRETEVSRKHGLNQQQQQQQQDGQWFFVPCLPFLHSDQLRNLNDDSDGNGDEDSEAKTHQGRCVLIVGTWALL